LAEIRRWLLETEPDRRVRNDAALRTFFIWLLEPDEARSQLERERSHWRERLDEFEAIREQPVGPTRKERAFRLALLGGIGVAEARLEWLDDAIGEVGSRAWRSARP
jgi:hypothetical protein